MTVKKNDKLWLSIASLLFPRTASEVLASWEEISAIYNSLFQGEVVERSLVQGVISWKQRYTGESTPPGGSPKRYLFRTGDGRNPSADGLFRLYKQSDSSSDGDGKTGSTCPERDEIPDCFHYLVDWYERKYLNSSDSPDAGLRDLDEGESSAVQIHSNPDLTATEKTNLLKARRGQGLFRRKVIEIDSTCRLTGINDIRFMVASHIKPWAASNNSERLDGYNGLLLAPHADHLFDNGFITFKRSGEVVVSPDAQDVYNQWMPPVGVASRPLLEQQEEYMQYHREHVFRGRFRAPRQGV